MASVACLGFGVFCLLSIQRKNPLFKTKDRSKELMPYKHQVLWTLCFGGVFLVLGSYLLLESVWTFNSSYEGKILNRYVYGKQRDGTPHHYFLIFTKGGMKKTASPKKNTTEDGRDSMLRNQQKASTER